MTPEQVPALPATTPTSSQKKPIQVEESRAQRLERQNARWRDRGGIFKPTARNTLKELLLSRTITGESPQKAGASEASRRISKGKGRASTTGTKAQPQRKASKGSVVKKVARKSLKAEPVDAAIEDDDEPVAGPSRLPDKPTKKAAAVPRKSTIKVKLDDVGEAPKRRGRPSKSNPAPIIVSDDDGEAQPKPKTIAKPKPKPKPKPQASAKATRKAKAPAKKRRPIGVGSDDDEDDDELIVEARPTSNNRAKASGTVPEDVKKDRAKTVRTDLKSMPKSYDEEEKQEEQEKPIPKPKAVPRSTTTATKKRAVEVQFKDSVAPESTKHNAGTNKPKARDATSTSRSKTKPVMDDDDDEPIVIIPRARAAKPKIYEDISDDEDVVAPSIRVTVVESNKEVDAKGGKAPKAVHAKGKTKMDVDVDVVPVVKAKTQEKENIKQSPLLPVVDVKGKGRAIDVIKEVVTAPVSKVASRKRAREVESESEAETRNDSKVQVPSATARKRLKSKGKEPERDLSPVVEEDEEEEEVQIVKPTRARRAAPTKSASRKKAPFVDENTEEIHVRKVTTRKKAELVVVEEAEVAAVGKSKSKPAANSKKRQAEESDSEDTINRKKSRTDAQDEEMVDTEVKKRPHTSSRSASKDKSNPTAPPPRTTAAKPKPKAKPKAKAPSKKPPAIKGPRKSVLDRLRQMSPPEDDGEPDPLDFWA